MRVLVADGDRGAAATAQRVLERAGMDVRVSASGPALLQLAGVDRFDVVVLARTLPDDDAVALCRRLRAAGVRTPVLVTGTGGVAERAGALDAGADDYLVTPYAGLELAARVRALGRRAARGTPLLRAGDLVLDTEGRRATREGRELHLTPTEFALLEALVRTSGRSLTREQLLCRVWGGRARGSNVVDVAVRRLRDKLDRPFDRPLVETVHRVGYRLRPADDGGAEARLLPVGAVAPDFVLPATGGRTWRLAEQRGAAVTLMFYEQDWSAGSAAQLNRYQREWKAFARRGAQVVAVSVDSVASHEAWSAARGLPFPLLADFHPKGAVARRYGAWDGQAGQARPALFLIGPDGRIRHAEIGPTPDLPTALATLDHDTRAA